MEVIIVDEPYYLVAKIIAQQVEKKSDSVLGLATGGTPVAVYQKLHQMHLQGLDFSQVSSFNLDEYLGLEPTHPASYSYYMNKNLFTKINISIGNTNIPNGMAKDVEKECLRYEQLIRDKGGIDLQLLGIGSDGHIGFNEPTSSLTSRTRIKTLTRRTKKDNARYFDGGTPPGHVITMGIGTIMESRKIVLIATGEAKAEAVYQMIEGPISANCPATILQMHQNVKVVLDQSASNLLQRKEYYQWVFQNKPEWQD